MSADVEPRSNRREQAIEHAADLLREGGPRALTSVAVAQRLGVTQSAVYRHVRDIEELSTLAANRLIADLNASLQHIVLDPGIDWEQIDDLQRLCEAVVHQMVEHAWAFAVVDQWRFVDGALGEGINQFVEDGQAMIGHLFESRWRIEFGFEGELGDAELSVVRVHARAVEDEIQAVARLLRSRTERRGLDDLADAAQLLQYRVLADWAAFVVDMNELVGLPFPTIDFDVGLPVAASILPRTTA